MSLPILFEMYAGDDHSIHLIVENSEGVPIDLTGVLFQATFKESICDPDSAAPVQVDVVPQFPAVGTVMLHFDNAQTRNLYSRKYYFDLQVINQGMISTILTGLVLVKGEVTQRGLPA
jgi:hypothetical protein